MASTCGSAAACSRNACTLVANDSYGWCSSTSPVRIAAKMSARPFGSRGLEGCSAVVGTCGG